ncbi:MAG: DUF3168 domain-containing protein [Silicimonas sp.]|nr:DUF3168 domain-containing protein [Silicimonas sp.]
MSYGGARDLQAAVYQLLVADGTLGALVGTAIYDELPPGALPSHYVSLGPEDVTDLSDQTGRMARHRFDVSVVSEGEGFDLAKRAAAAVSDVVLAGPWGLARGHVVSMSLHRTRARRVRRGELRRIDLTFQALVDDI